MEAKGFVNIKFIVFLKATLGKMMATEILPNGFIDLHFWQSWPRRFYNIKCYHNSKEPETHQETHQQKQNDLGLTDDILETQVPKDGEDAELSQSILSDMVKYLLKQT